MLNDFPGGSDGKASARNAGDPGSIPGLGRSSGEGNHSPVQYSGLENSVDCIVHEVTKSQTRLSDFHFHYIYIYHCIHGMEYYSATKKKNEKNEILPFATMWMDIETIMFSEIS